MNGVVWYGFCQIRTKSLKTKRSDKMKKIYFILALVFLTASAFAQGNLNCVPDILDIQINGQTVEFGGSINIELNSLDETFQIRLRGKNVGTDNCPSPYNNLTLSFVQFNSSGDKSRISFSNYTDTDLDEGLYFGSEAGGGDAYADYVMYEAVDNNYWQAGELNAVFLNVQPKNWGEFVIKFRMGLGTDESYANFNYDPSGGYIGNDDPNSSGDCLGFESYKITVNVEQTPQTGDLNVKVKNIDGTSTPYPADNGRVQLYDNTSSWVATDYTDSEGNAFFSQIEEGSGYYYKVYHNPDDPENIFGEEYWGKKENITIYGNTTNYSEFTRNMPYGEEIKVYSDGQDVTNSNVAAGTELEFRIKVKNPNPEDLKSFVRLVLDRNKDSGYDYDEQSGGEWITGNNGEKIFIFYITLNEEGDYYSTFSTRTDVNGEYRNTDGWRWSEQPIITIEPAYGDLSVEVKNIDGTSTPYPADNGRVQLYDNGGTLVATEYTDTNGKAYFSNVEAGSGYYYKVYHTPDDPNNIFGEEYWGQKTDVTISANTPNSSEFTRNMPYGKGDGIKAFYNGEEVTYGAIPAGREVEFRVTVVNPNIENKTSKVRLVIDQNKAASYDYDRLSEQKTVSGNNGETIYTFSVTLNSVGDYFAVINTQTEVDGAFMSTDGWAWQEKPIITVENTQSTINFAGMTWHVKEGPSLSPGPNNFSSSTNSVWVDSDGNLHLKVRKVGDRWYCSEVYTDDFMENAEYTFYVSSNVENYDPNVVAAMFLYENDNEELDIEFSRWGDSNNDPGWYIVQPSETSGNSHGFPLNLNGDYSTHKFTWRNDRIDFQSYHGHYSEIPDPPEDYLIEEWTYTGDDNPEDNGQKRLHLNFWLHNGTSPTDGQEAEFIVKNVIISHPEGSVNFYVEDQLHSLKEGALINIYMDDGSTISGVTNESGAYFFQNLPVGTFSYDVYNQQETGPEQELWGSGQITINENESTSYTHTRDYPYTNSMYGYQNGENIYPGQEVAAGSHIEIRFEINNDVTWSGFDTRVTMYLDRDMADPMDNEQQQTQYIDASSTYTFSFPFDIPIDWGGSEMHVKGVVESYINGNWQQTDLVDWDEYEPFYVGADTVRPELTETYPADGEVVKSQDAGDVTIVFSEDVNQETVNENTFYVEYVDEDTQKVSGHIEMGATPDTYRFIPDNGFEEEKTYYCTVTSQVQDLSGNYLKKDTTWSFIISNYEKVLYEVPYYWQENTSWCWAASTAMLLEHYGFSKKIWEVAADFDASPTTESDITDIAEYLNTYYNNGEENPWEEEKHLFSNSYIKEVIIRVLNSGHILFLGHTESFEGHAVVVTGYSSDSVWVNDPSGALFYNDYDSNNDLTHHRSSWDEFFEHLDETFFSPYGDCDVLYNTSNNFTENHGLGSFDVVGGDIKFSNSYSGTYRYLELEWDGSEEYQYGYYYKKGLENDDWYPHDEEIGGYKATKADILKIYVHTYNHTNPFKTLYDFEIEGKIFGNGKDTTFTYECSLIDEFQYDWRYVFKDELRTYPVGMYTLRLYLKDMNSSEIHDSLKVYFSVANSEYAGLESTVLSEEDQKVPVGQNGYWDIEIKNLGSESDVFKLEDYDSKGEFQYEGSTIEETPSIEPGEKIVFQYIYNTEGLNIGDKKIIYIDIKSKNDENKSKRHDLNIEIIEDNTAPIVIINTTESNWFNNNNILDIDFKDDYSLDNMWYQIDSNDDTDPSNWHPLTSDGVNTLAESQDNQGKEMITNWKMSNEDWDNLPLNSENQGWHHIYFKVSDDAGNVYITPTQEDAFTFGKDDSPPEVRFTYPEENQVLNETTVEIRWTSNDLVVGLELSGVANHFIAMDQNSDFIELPADQKSYTFSNLSEGTHTAYLYATDNAGNTSETRVLNFEINTSINPPNAFNLLNPEKGIESQNLQPTFTWEETTDPDGTNVTYDFYYAYTAGYENATIISGLSETQYTPDSPLNDNSTLYWKVKAIDEDGQVTWSNQTDWYIYLNQSNEAPLSFNLVDPADEITVSTLTPTFTWTNSSDNDPNDEITYTLWVGTDVNYSSGSFNEYANIEGTSYTLTEPLDANTTYYWKVKAVDNHGVETWSNEQDRWFKTPENNNPVLTWTGETGFESDGVNPDEEVEGSTFEFRIKYTDADGDEPGAGYPVVHILDNGTEISGSPFAMSAVNSDPVTDGRIYTFSTSSLVASNNYSYRFDAQDANGANAEGEGTNTMNGPVVTENNGSGGDSLVAYWSFDDGTATDNSGNGNNGTLQGEEVPSTVEGVYGNALQFNGNNYIEIENLSEGLKQFPSREHSYSCWIYLDDVINSTKYITDAANPSAESPLNDQRGIRFESSQNIVSKWVTQDGVVKTSSQTALELNQWYHICAVNDGSTGKIYINGIEDSSETITAWGGDIVNFFIGATSGGGGGFIGRIDELKLFNKALSQSEINELANINNAPTLSFTGETGYESDGVNPDEEVEGSTFEFRIKYTDADGDEPGAGYPVVHIFDNGTEISGSPFAMSAVNSDPVTDGRIYTYSTSSLTASNNYSYRFEAQDVNGALAEGEGTSTINGPVVTENNGIGGDSLVAYWSFNDGNTSIATDVTGNGNDGTVYEATLTTGYDGVENQAFYFDSNNDTIKINIQESLSSINQSDYSVSMWIKLDEIPSENRFALDMGDVDQFGFRFNGNSTPVYKYNTSSTSVEVIADTALGTGGWEHLVSVLDGTSGKVYINGKLHGTETVPDHPSKEIIKMAIGNICGGGSGSTFFPGAIDEIKIFNKALTESEIQHLYKGNAAPSLTWTGENGYESDGVNPDSAQEGSTFEFRVKYTDFEGDEPGEGYPVLHIFDNGTEINGSPFVMSAVNSDPVTEGRIYTYSTSSLTASDSYTYRFEAQDVNGAAAEGEGTNTMNGPFVTDSVSVEPIGITMNKIDGGTFIMGNNDGESDEYPEHEVTVSTFQLSKYEITNHQFVELYNWALEQGKISVNSTTVENTEGERQELLDLDAEGCYISYDGAQLVVEDGRDDQPVCEVTWYGAVAFCNYYSEKNGLTPVYNLNDWSCNWNGNGYRLPTEAEWEFAAGGGNQSHDYEYSGSDDVDEVGWYVDNSGSQPHDVGTKNPNELELYDMSGNNQEWCWDYFGSYSKEPQTDPVGPSSQEDERRILRGGSWNSTADILRVTNREHISANLSNGDTGFRIARKYLGEPTLTWTGEIGYESDGVNPDTLNEHEIATFKVKYIDKDNDPPANGYPKIYIYKDGYSISGSPFTMSEANSDSFAAGRIYLFEIDSLVSGDGYSYKFEAKDVNDLLAFGEATNEQVGPYIKESSVTVKIKVFLQGPFDSDTMKTVLLKENYIPLEQPFDQAPWNYAGKESVNMVPDSVVDWLLIELRAEVDSSSIVSRRAVFLKNNGQIIDTSGVDQVRFVGVDPGDYYIVIYHRNHLAIMSNEKVDLDTDNVKSYDFSTGQDKAYGIDALVELNDGIFGMYGGDANANGQIQNDDKNDYWKSNVGTAGYKTSDFNLNGEVQNDDKNDIWKNNVGLGSHVDTQATDKKISATRVSDKTKSVNIKTRLKEKLR